MKQQVAERIADYAPKATIGAGAFGAVWGWITVEHLFSAASVIIALLGLVATIYFKRKSDARNEREAALREELLRARIEHLRSDATAAAHRIDTDWGQLGGGE